MKRKLICFLFAAMAFHALEYESVWADGKSRNVNVTVPATINAVFNEDGSNSISEYSVNNQSLVPVHIDNINSTEKNGWSLVPKGEKILKDQKKVSLSINNHSLLSGDNEVNIAIPEESTTPLNIDIGRGAYGFDVKGSAFDLSLRYRVGQKDFSIIFNCKGGDAIETQLHKNGTVITLPTPSRDGWTFTGWTDSHGVVHQAGENYTVPIGGETFTANWIENTSTLVSGSIFNDTINRLKSESSQTITSIVFTNSPISGDKKESAKLVSEVNSNFRSYAYLDGDTIYVSPEREGITIYANRDSSFMFNNQSKLISISFDNFDTSNINSIRAMFQSCSSLRSLDISKFNTENVTNMGYVFFSCYSLSSADVSNWNTSKVTDMSYMFFSCSRLDRLDVSNWKTGKVKDMSGVFNGCSKLIELNLSSWDTSKVTSMSRMFSGCSGLPSLDISKFKTEAVKTTESMFRGCSSLQYIDLSNFNTSSLTNIDSMFYSCASLISVDFSNFDTSRVTDMGDLFYRCSKLESITKIEDFNVSNVKNFIGMFESCSSLTRLDFSKWDTRNVINMSKMFYECSSLSEIVGLENLNTENVTNMSEMFKVCRSLTSLNLSGWDTRNVTNMSGMFGSCKLTSLDLSGLDTRNVTDMSKMFSYCYSLESLNLSNWDTSKVKNMNYMFDSCTNLNSVIGLENFDTSSTTSMKNMFYSCRSLVFPKLPNLISSSVDDVTRMFSGCFSFDGEITINNPSISTYTSMFESCSSYSSNKGLIVKYVDEDTKEMAKKLISTKSKGSKIYLYEPEGSLVNGASFNQLIPRDTTSITFSNDPIPQDKIDSATLVSIENSFEEVYLWRSDTSSKDWFVSPKREGIKICSNLNLSGMFNGKPNLSRINFDNFDTSSAVSMYRMFAECPSLVELDLSGFNTENITNMSCMFYNSKKLERINLTGFNTEKVSDMSIMFQKCSSLSEIVGLSSFDTRNVVKMNSMFSHCTSLTKLDLSSFTTPKVDDMSFVFEGCGNLRSLNISKFNTSKVSNMRSMFDGCSSLTSLDLSNWDTSKVNNMVSMFRNCSNLSNINGIDSFNTSNVLDMSSMFSLCSKLSELNFSSSWCTEKVTSFSSMFNGCHSLSRIIGLNNFNTSNANNMGSMFSDCFKLTEIDLTSFDTANVVNMGSMFSNCRLVTSLDVSRFNTSEVTSMQRMFSECTSLKSLDLSNFNVSKVANMYSTFYKANSLSSLTGLSEWNTSNVTTMSGLFNGCSSLLSVDLTGWNTENVNNMSSMFTGCGKLSSIDVSSFNTANVTDMGGMFSSCNSLTSLNLSNFDTSNVTNMGGMFYGCYGINKLDVSSFNTEKVTSMNTMFYSLATPSLDLSHFNTSKVSNFGMMFYGSKIKNLNVSSFDFSSARDLNYMFQNAGNLVSEVTINNPNLSGNSIATFAGTSITPNSRFVVKYVDDATKEIAKKLVGTKSSNSNVYLFEKEGTLIGGEAFNKLIPDDVTSITFSNNPIPQDKIASATLVSTQDSFEEVYLWKEDLSDNIVSKVIRFITGRSGEVNRYHVSPKNDGVTICANSDCLKMFSAKKELVEINFENFDTSKATSLRNMFYACSKLKHINGLDSFNTSKVYDLYCSFYGCSSLVSVDLSSFNVSRVVNMGNMFSYCTNLTSLNLSNWDTSSLTSMGYMFDGCSSLLEVDLSNWDTSGVTGMDAVFRECSKLIEVDLSNWDTSRVRSMRGMFLSCSSLRGIDVSNWKVGRVTNFDSMFKNCSKLSALDISSWDTSNAKEMDYMFYNCKLVKELNVSNWNTDNVVDMLYMFYGCSSLTQLDLSNWDISNVTNMGGAFHSCSKLESINMPNSDASSEKLTSTYSMFSNCASLTSLDLRCLDTSKVYDMSYMFNNCSKLVEIIGLDEFNTANVTSISYMFSGCKSFTSLDLRSFDTTNVQVMYSMFSGCSKLSEILGLEGFNTSKLRSMENIFYNCSSLESVDVGGWDTSSIVRMDNMFNGCKSIRSLDLSSWNTGKVAYFTGMFGNAKIGNIDISNFDFSKADNVYKMFESYSSPYTIITINKTRFNNSLDVFKNAVTDEGSIFVVNYAEGCEEVANRLIKTKSPNSNVVLYQSESKLVSGSKFKDLIPDDATSITFSNQAIPSGKIKDAVLVSSPDSFERLYLWKEDVSNNVISKIARWVTGRSGDVNRYHVSAKKPNIIMYANENCSSMFYGKDKLKSISFENFNTSRVTNMTFMFNGCEKLSRVDGIANFRTNNVTSMEYMFYNCKDLTSLDLSNWSTGEVTTMSHMFNYCSSLVELNLVGWNTSKVTNMSAMFGRLLNMPVINVSSFDTSEVTDMSYMFDYGYKLTNIIGLNSFNTAKVTNMSNMFEMCYLLVSLDLSSFDTSGVTNMRRMFDSCLVLSNINGLDRFNLDAVNDMSRMFKGCLKLSGRITISNPNITLYENMFNESSTAEGSKFIVRYAEGCEEVASNMVATASDNSNVHIFENYSITFELNGGTNPDNVTNSYNVDSETITLPTPSREGYDFGGWFTSNELTGDASTEIPSGSIGNKTFYAKWTPKKYNVVFDSNYVDGENLYNKHNIDMYDVSKWYYSNYTCTYEPVIDYSIPSGRYMKLTIGENYNGSEIGGPYLERLPLEVGKVYTWEADIRVSRDGIVGSVGPEQGGNIDSLALSTEWKTYKNTFTASDRGVNAFVFYFDNSNINVGDEIHVTNIKLVEGSAGSNTESKDYDSEIGGLTTPSREGYSFLGWYDNAVGGTKIESTTKVPLNGVTYYAHWQPNKCNITLNDNYANGDNLAPHAHDLSYWRFNSTINAGKSSLSLKDDDTLESGKYIEVNLGPSIDNSHVGLFYNGLPSSLENGKTYTWSIKVKASKPGVLSHIGHEQAGYLYNSEIDTEWKTITHTFVANTSYSHRAFVVYYNKGAFNEGDKIYLSDLKLIEGSPNTNVVAKDYGSVVGELPTPRREGYSFLGWYDKPFGGNRVDNLIKVPLNGVNYYAQWSINSHVNEIHHWIWGFERGEGQNHNKQAFKIDLARFDAKFGSKFVLDSSKAVNIPNGFELVNRFGNGEISGVWADYPMGTEVTQIDRFMKFEYDYNPINYNITYNLNGGINSPDNPSTYNVLYGVNLKNPTRTGYSFTGWYINGERIDGINVGADAQFSSVEDVYSKLSSRTTGDITVAAGWRVNIHTLSYDAQGGSLNSVTDNPNNYLLIPNGTYAIQSKHVDSYYIHVYHAQISNGANICTHPSYGVHAKQTLWTFERYKDTPYYYIQSVSGGKLLELEGSYSEGTVTNSSAIQVWSQGNGDVEKDFLWYLVSDADGSVKIKNLATGAVIGIPNGSYDANVKLTQQEDNSNVNHQSWNLIDVDIKEYPDRTKQFGSALYVNSSVPIKTGYTFTGWNTNKDGTGTMYQPGSKYNPDQNGGVVVLYAQWRPNTYTIKFDGTYADSGSTASMTVNYGETVNLSNNGFWKNAHNFIGWNTKSYGTGDSYLNQQEVSNLSSKDGDVITLHAQWEPANINYSFNTNNGQDGYSVNGVLGDIVDLENPTRGGYTFNGWDKSNHYGLFGKYLRDITFDSGKLSGIEVYKIWYSYSSDYGRLELVDASDDNPTDSDYEVKITATAPYNYEGTNTYAGFCTTGFNDVGKSYVHTFKAKLPKGVKVETAYNPLGDGGKIHWYTEQYGTGEWETYSYKADIGTNGSTWAIGFIYISSIDDEVIKLPFSWNLAYSKIIEVTDVGTDPVLLLGSGNNTLTAKWSGNSYYVNYNSNYGSGHMGSQHVKSGVETNLSPNTFRKLGYSFGGWNTNPYGTGVSYSDGQVITELPVNNGGNITLYAQWVPNKYSINIDNSIIESDSIGRIYRLPKKDGSNIVAMNKNEGSNALFGRFLFKDDFASPHLYNNKGNGSVKIEYASSLEAGYPYSDRDVFKITSTGDASPGHGGFVDFIASGPNKVIIHSFCAKLPKGTIIGNHSNEVGSGSRFEWLTTQFGTGEWEWYAYKLVCGPTGNFSSFGHVTVNHTDEANEPSKDNPLVWYLGHHNAIDATNQNSADNDAVINLGTNDLITTQWTKSSVLGEESVAPSIDESNVEEVENNDSSNPSTSDETVVDSDN